MRKGTSGIFGVMLVVAIIFVSCSSLTASTTKKGECPVTAPTESLNSSDSWIGEVDGLQVLISDDGDWSDLPQNDRGYQVETLFRYPNFDGSLEPFPFLNIVGRRLNAEENFEYTQILVGRNAPEETDEWVFLSTNLTLSESGCWKISGYTNESEVRFVVWIEGK